MNFIVSTNTLLKYLKLISGVLSSNSTIPILDNFLFEIVPGQLMIHASDMETTITTVIKVESKDAGSIAIPAKPLLETLSNFPEQPLTFSIDTLQHGIKIITDNGEYKLTGHNGDEYPRIPKIEASSSIVLKTDIVAAAINKTLFATGNDDLRPVMNGVFFQFSENETLFVATDAHKLVKYRRVDSKANAPSSFIVPKKPLNLLKNFMAGIEDTVVIEFNKTNASFNFGTTTLVCRLIDGKYPNYDAVIPKVNPNKLTIDRSVLIGALKRVSIYSSKATLQVRFKITGSVLDISAEDIDYSNAAHETLNCSYIGEDMEIGFNSKFLLEMLNNIETDEIDLEMSAPNRAGIITPTKRQNPSEDVIMLIMPVMLNN